MCPKDADGMANSVDPEQTAPLGAVWSVSTLLLRPRPICPKTWDHTSFIFMIGLAPSFLSLVRRSYQYEKCALNIIWAPSSEFVSSSIPSWQILTAHVKPFMGARDLAFCLKVPLDSLLVWASSGGSGETARMRSLAWTFAARIGDKYQIRLTRPIWLLKTEKKLVALFYWIHVLSYIFLAHQ